MQQMHSLACTTAIELTDRQTLYTAPSRCTLIPLPSASELCFFYAAMPVLPSRMDLPHWNERIAKMRILSRQGDRQRQ